MRRSSGRACGLATVAVISYAASTLHFGFPPAAPHGRRTGTDEDDPMNDMATAGLVPKYAYEDFYEGRVFLLGPILVTAEEIIAFASEFDAQPMHLDEEAGRASLLGGLAASGWHMTALLMKMMSESFILDSTSEGAPGVDTLEWKRPLLAGDSFGGTSTVVSRRLSASRKGIGIVQMRHELKNQRGETVMICNHAGMMRVRNVEAVQ